MHANFMNTRNLPLLLALGVLLFSGCSLMQTKRGVAEQQAAALGEKAVDLPDRYRAPSEPGIVPVDWLDRFKSQTLNRLVEEAQGNNRDLQATAALVERSRALAVKAGARLQPSLNAGANGGWSGLFENSADEGLMGLNARVSWELDVWGGLSAGRRGALAGAVAAEADLEAAQLAIAAATARAYVAAIESRLQEELALENIGTLESVNRIVQSAYENGSANKQDLALSQSDLSLSKAQLEEVKLARREALRALELLLGRYPGAELGLDDDFPALPPPPPAGLPSDLLERRPDLAAAERRVAAAFEATARARAARLPTFSLTGDLGGSSSDLDEVLDPANVAWQAFANILAPVLDGGSRKADVAIATAEQEQAVANYTQLALVAFGEVERFLDLGDTLGRSSVQTYKAAEEAEQALNVAQMRYKEGEVPLFDVLDVQQRVAARKAQAINVRRQLLEQRINLYLALGGDW